MKHAMPIGSQGTTEFSPMAGWIMDRRFAAKGRFADDDVAALRLRVINPELGTSAGEAARQSFLEQCLKGRAPHALHLASGGFFGMQMARNGTLDWVRVADPMTLRKTIETIVRKHVANTSMLAVGVDVDVDHQQQWWFRGGRNGGFVRAIERLEGGWTLAKLEERKVECAGRVFLGFVCGEVYEWPRQQQRAALADVDIVAVSAHAEVNRQRAHWIDPSRRRWAFQRRFQAISTRCGAALAQSRGPNDNRVRNCDNWFVHRGRRLFQGQSHGTRVVAV